MIAMTAGARAEDRDGCLAPLSMRWSLPSRLSRKRVPLSQRCSTLTLARALNSVRERNARADADRSWRQAA